MIGKRSTTDQVEQKALIEFRPNSKSGDALNKQRRNVEITHPCVLKARFNPRPIHGEDDVACL
ncbi:MAG: hypothetical protein JWM27_939 [Gemmatimonadetes bacterium]|nr:hypothetical protein [Gemmatimonadota bacterium]